MRSRMALLYVRISLLRNSSGGLHVHYGGKKSTIMNVIHFIGDFCQRVSFWRLLPFLAIMFGDIQSTITMFGGI